MTQKENSDQIEILEKTLFQIAVKHRRMPCNGGHIESLLFAPGCEQDHAREDSRLWSVHESQTHNYIIPKIGQRTEASKVSVRLIKTIILYIVKQWLSSKVHCSALLSWVLHWGLQSSLMKQEMGSAKTRVKHSHFAQFKKSWTNIEDRKILWQLKLSDSQEWLYIIP